ncbi:DUF6894 family protein [Novosphingobium terrae]|uniref:DUF6894 family protein n=1 Tax=Novosphingobium terrae TaxID=2726189 RepID=UPI00197CCD46|nr:hypothetical protein [Novosphingobium terrae]
MPVFKLRLNRPGATQRNDPDMDFHDLHHAYIEVCKAIPGMACDLLAAGDDPMVCTYVIYDSKGRHLMDVPFVDILSPSEWRLRRATRKPHSGVRSAQVRDDLAAGSFRRMFSAVNVGCVLLTPELQVKEINDFGARHSHVDAEAIRDTSILDVFDLHGKPKENFAKFWALSQRGATAELIDMPYLVLDEAGQTVNGWWNARVWPIFDDDERLLGLVEWAEPFTRPSAKGNTLVRISPGSAG